jgi:hypothetical protein
VGASRNIIAASWQALAESFEYGLDALKRRGAQAEQSQQEVA